MYNENETAAPKNTAAVAAAAYRIEGLLYQSVNAKKVFKNI